MKNYKVNTELIYINKDRINEMSFLFLIISSVFFIMFFINRDVSNDMLNIMSTILCLATMILAFVTSNYSKHKFFNFCGIAFLILGLINILHIAPDYKTDSIILVIFQNDYFNLAIQIAEVLFVLISYWILKDEKKYYVGILFFLIFVSLGLFLQFKLQLFNEWMQKDIEAVVSIVTIIALCTIYEVSDEGSDKHKIKKEICYFRIFIMTTMISDLINFFRIPSQSPMISFFVSLCSCYAYATIFYAILEKLFNKPYNVLFYDLYERNEQLYEINKKILMQNRELQKSQTSLKEREEIYKRIFYNIPLPMVILNEDNNRIIYANKTFRELLKNQNLREIINKNIYNIINVKDSKDEVFEGRKFSVEGKVFVNGEEIILEIREFSNKYNTDEYILILQDITNEKKIQDIELKLEQKRLEEKMRSDFLSTISHDLKTPVNVIYSAMQLQNILIENEKIEDIKKYNLINKENCMTLIRLTNNLIDCSKITYDYLKPQYELINIVEFVEEIVTQVIEYAKTKNTQIIFDTDEEEIFVLCDRNFVERIILNLISNSIKYTNKGNIWVKVNVRESYVDIEVIDNGKGMDEEFLKVAFKKYSMESHKTDIRYRNSGIGLYVVKSLVNLQGGTIDIWSKKGEGTKITVTFVRENAYEQIRS